MSSDRSSRHFPNQRAVRQEEWPVAFEEATIAARSEVEQAIAADIQNQFVRNVESGPMDGNDPAYRQRWRTARSEADDRMRALYGWQGYSAIQLAAAQKRYAEEQAASEDGN